MRGQLEASPTMTLETVGPKNAGGFTRTLAQDKGTVTAVTELLVEQHLIESGLY